VFIAGHEREAVSSEWQSHLSGETGAGLSADRQVREAAGFVLAAVRCRLHDAADLIWKKADAVLAAVRRRLRGVAGLAWKPVDAALASRALSGLVVLLATLGVSALFIREGGLYGLADHLEAVAVAWGAAMGLVHVGRQWSDVKPPERKTHRKAR
jgi:hypothetical protein